MPDEARKPDKATPNRPIPTRLLLYAAGALLLFFVWKPMFEDAGRRELSYSQFKRHLGRGEVAEVLVREDEIVGRIAPREALDDVELQTEVVAEGDAPTEPFAFRSVRVEDPGLVAALEAAGVDYAGGRTSAFLQILLAWIFPLGLLALLWIFLMRRSGAPGQAALGFGKSRAHLVADREVGVTFDDVAGCDDAKLELQEIVEFLRDPTRFTALGARIPKGVLVVGPPGTGKTLIARAVAGEAGVPFFSLSGSDFVEMFVGVGAARVRDLFQQAKALAPCIIFIDELDAIGRQRGVHIGNVNDEREHTLNQLLVEMDGFEANAGVILLSATNRPDVLDPALLRPGRFDRQVVLDAPDAVGRLAILKVHARGKPLDDGVDLDVVARTTAGFSGADLANAINEAALLAARRDAHSITQNDLESAVEKVVAGPEQKSRRLSDAEKRRVACHEVGHAVVAAHSASADPVHKISIVPRGRAALGYTLQLPTGDRHLLARSELLDRLAGLLGGRAGEEVMLGEVSSGAENDLELATGLARRAVCAWGMGESAGLMHCAHRAEAFPVGDAGIFQRDCSEETAHAIDDEVKQLLDTAYREAMAILTKHRDQLERVSDRLLVCETLDAAEFTRLLEDPPHAASAP